MQEGGVQHQMYQKFPDQPLQETHKFCLFWATSIYLIIMVEQKQN